MSQKAKRRTKIASLADPIRNGNGFHKNHAWVPGDPIENHPLAGVAGSFKDDPFWDEFIQIMKDERRKEDERYFKDLEEE